MMELRPTPAFYRFAAVCSILSAATTLVLIFGPRFYSAPATLEQAVALRSDPAYLFRLWVYFFHPYLVFSAALAIAVYKLRDSAGSVLLGLFSFFTWALLEALQQGFALAALNQAWRAGFAAATDAAARDSYRTLLLGFEGMWDAFYLVLLTAFVLANLAYGIATRGATGLEGWVSLAFFAAAALSAATWLANFGGVAWLGPAVQGAYPLIQPAARVLFGVWLLQIARSAYVDSGRAVAVSRGA